ncbi:hypothetical protein CHU98_g2448 [Xylaria longipes]|nr:hypothetical protein CHU98_g2448 [Xylaria longipes]
MAWPEMAYCAGFLSNARNISHMHQGPANCKAPTLLTGRRSDRLVSRTSASSSIHSQRQSKSQTERNTRSRPRFLERIVIIATSDYRRSLKQPAETQPSLCVAPLRPARSDTVGITSSDSAVAIEKPHGLPERHVCNLHLAHAAVQSGKIMSQMLEIVQAECRHLQQWVTLQWDAQPRYEAPMPPMILAHLVVAGLPRVVVDQLPAAHLPFPCPSLKRGPIPRLLPPILEPIGRRSTTVVPAPPIRARYQALFECVSTISMAFSILHQEHQKLGENLDTADGMTLKDGCS